MSKKHPSRRVGREAIELLKDYYANGDGQFSGTIAIVHWFKDQHRIRCGYHQAQAWDRQARLERADELQATTFPNRRNSYTRQAAPAHGERRIGRRSRHQDTLTRLVNDEREAKADAAQADASAIERAQVAMFGLARQTYETAATLD